MTSYFGDVHKTTTDFCHLRLQKSPHNHLTEFSFFTSAPLCPLLRYFLWICSKNSHCIGFIICDPKTFYTAFFQFSSPTYKFSSLTYSLRSDIYKSNGRLLCSESMLNGDAKFEDNCLFEDMMLVFTVTDSLMVSKIKLSKHRLKIRKM